MVSSSDMNVFDKFCNIWPQSVTMEQIASLALTSKVILSYKIDSLSSFHDKLMKGLWKKSSNGCLYPMDNRCENVLYVEINEEFGAETGKLMEKLQNFCSAQQVFDERSELVLISNQNRGASFVVENTVVSHTNGVENGVGNKLSKLPLGSNEDLVELVDSSSICDANKVQVEVADFLQEKMKCKTAMLGNLESQLDRNASNFHFPLIDEINEDLKCQFDCIWVDDTQFQNTRVFNEILEREVGIGDDKETIVKQDDSLINTNQVFDEISNPISVVRQFLAMGIDHISILAPLSPRSDFASIFCLETELLESIVNPRKMFVSQNEGGVGSACYLLDGPFRVNPQAVIDMMVKLSELSGDLKVYDPYDLSCVIGTSGGKARVMMGFIFYRGRRIMVSHMDARYHAMIQCSGNIASAWVSMSYHLMIIITGGPLCLYLTYTLVDKGDFRSKGEKILHVKYTWELFHIVGFWRKCIPGRIDESALLISYVFDLGGKSVPEILGGVFISCVQCIGTDCHEEMEVQVKVFDQGLLFWDKLVCSLQEAPLQGGKKCITYGTIKRILGSLKIQALDAFVTESMMYGILAAIFEIYDYLSDLWTFTLCDLKSSIVFHTHVCAIISSLVMVNVSSQARLIFCNTWMSTKTFFWVFDPGGYGNNICRRCVLSTIERKHPKSIPKADDHLLIYCWIFILLLESLVTLNQTELYRYGGKKPMGKRYNDYEILGGVFISCVQCIGMKIQQ